MHEDVYEDDLLIVRNHLGKPVDGFHCSGWASFSLAAEGFVLRAAVPLASRRYQMAFMESDCLLLVLKKHIALTPVNIGRSERSQNVLDILVSFIVTDVYLASN